MQFAEEPDLLYALTLSPGTRVGSATILRRGEPRRQNSSKTLDQFELECDCGKLMLRTADRLRRALKYGGEVACWRCQSEARRGALIFKNSIRKSRWLRVWNEYQCLYASDYDERFRHRLLSELEEQCGELPAWPHDEVEVLLHAAWNRWLQALDNDESGAARPTQQEQWLFPLTGEAGWQCAACRAPVTKIHGCVRCLAAVCNDCVSLGLHSCRNWEGTWHDESHDEESVIVGRRLRKIIAAQLKPMLHRDVRMLKVNSARLRETIMERLGLSLAPTDLEIAPFAYEREHCGGPARVTKRGLVYCPACGTPLSMLQAFTL